jgi:hypothetical protein
MPFRSIKMVLKLTLHPQQSYHVVDSHLKITTEFHSKTCSHLLQTNKPHIYNIVSYDFAHYRSSFFFITKKFRVFNLI